MSKTASSVPSRGFIIAVISLGISTFGFSFLGLKRLSTATLFSMAWNISLQLSSSISFPLGALPMNFTSVTWSSSLRIRSPPRSPSSSAVAVFSLVTVLIVSGTFAPSKAIVLSIPHRIRLIMSALPSTMIISLLSGNSGPAGSSSGPYFSTFWILMVSPTSLNTSSTLGCDSIVHL